MAETILTRRVGFVVTSDQSAGFLRGYLRYLSSRGWQVSLLANDEGRLAEVGSLEGIRTIAVPMRREPSIIRDLASLIQLVRAIRGLRLDALVYSTPKAALLAAIAGWLCRVPIRNYELWGLRHETTSGAQRILLRSMERLVGRLSTQVVADSESLARLAEAEGVARSVSTVGAGSALGVDVARFSRAAPDLSGPDRATAAFLAQYPDLPRVLFVGRINRDKGVDTLLSAVRQLSGTGRPVACIVVGPDEDEDLGAELTEASRSLPIHLVGAVTDPRPYYLSADLLCLPTLREGFGQVIIEAAAMGVPAVTTNATGARDAVVHGRTGLVVPVRSATDLAEGIWMLASDRSLAQQYGDLARTRAKDEFCSDLIWRLHAEHLDVLHARLAIADRGNRSSGGHSHSH